MKNTSSTGTTRSLPPLPTTRTRRSPMSTSASRNDRTSAARSPPSTMASTIARSRCVSRSATNAVTSSAGRLSGSRFGWRTSRPPDRGPHRDMTQQTVALPRSPDVRRAAGTGLSARAPTITRCSNRPRTAAMRRFIVAGAGPRRRNATTFRRSPPGATASPDSRTGPSARRRPARATGRRGTQRSSPDRTRTPAPSPARTPAPPDAPGTGCPLDHLAVTDEAMPLPSIDNTNLRHDGLLRRVSASPHSQWWTSRHRPAQGRLTDRRSSVRSTTTPTPSSPTSSSTRSAATSRDRVAARGPPARPHHRAWRDQIAAWHRAHVSNGPTEAINNLVKRVKRSRSGSATSTTTASAHCSTPADPTGPSSPPSPHREIRSAGFGLPGPVSLPSNVRSAQASEYAGITTPTGIRYRRVHRATERRDAVGRGCVRHVDRSEPSRAVAQGLSTPAPPRVSNTASDAPCGRPSHGRGAERRVSSSLK